MQSVGQRRCPLRGSCTPGPSAKCQVQSGGLGICALLMLFDCASAIVRLRRRSTSLEETEEERTRHFKSSRSRAFYLDLGKKTPGGAGTHGTHGRTRTHGSHGRTSQPSTQTQADTDPHENRTDHTDEPHNHPPKPNDTNPHENRDRLNGRKNSRKPGVDRSPRTGTPTRVAPSCINIMKWYFPHNYHRHSNHGRICLNSWGTTVHCCVYT